LLFLIICTFSSVVLAEMILRLLALENDRARRAFVWLFAAVVGLLGGVQILIRS